MEAYYNIAKDHDNDDFPLLLFTLSIARTRSVSPLNTSTIDLVSKILSREEYIALAALIDHPSDAKHLLDFIWHLLHHYSLSNQDSNMSRRAKQFMLTIIPRMHNLAPSNIHYDSNNYTFPLLLFTINNKEPESPITSIVNQTTIDLMTDILFREDYIELAAQLVDLSSDAKNLLDFMPHILHYYSLPKQDSIKAEMNRRGKRFMLAIISILHGAPLSNMPYDHHDNTLPLLLYILNNNKPILSVVNAFTIGLMDEILSREDYIDLATALGNASNSRNLLDFMIHMICNHGISNWGSTTDIIKQAMQFMLNIMSRMPVVLSYNMSPPSYGTTCNMLSLFLSLLNHRKPQFPITSLLDATMVDLMCDILSREDCIGLAIQLYHTSDVKNLLDFLLDMLIHWRILYPNLVTARRARQFILEVIPKIYAVPPANVVRGTYCALHPYILYIITNRKPELPITSARNATMADFMCDILLRADYMDFAAQVHHPPDAASLLNLLLDTLDCQHSLSYDSYECTTSIDIIPRARRLMSQVIPKADTHALPLLLCILGKKKIANTSLVSETKVEILYEILSRKDFVDLATQVDNVSDARILLDFILGTLRNRSASNSQRASINVPQRARRFMCKIISKIPVIPPSLIVTGVSIPIERNYIGGGGFGRVFKGRIQNKVVALKVLYKSDNQVAFCREALMWRSLNHKFVLPFLGIHEIKDPTAPQFFLVSPYMKNGTLSRWRKQTNPLLPPEIESRILEVAQAMEYIHSEGAIHGDLRGENVLLDDYLHVQIADFGLTRISEATNTRSGALHLNFAAPELFGLSEGDDDTSDDAPPRTQMTDVYAFGCLYYEIYYDSIPYAGKADLQILALVSRGVLPPRLEEQPLSDEAWEVIQRCWVREPSKRPAMKNITESMIALSASSFRHQS